MSKMSSEEMYLRLVEQQSSMIAHLLEENRRLTTSLMEMSKQVVTSTLAMRDPLAAGRAWVDKHTREESTNGSSSGGRPPVDRSIMDADVPGDQSTDVGGGDWGAGFLGDPPGRVMSSADLQRNFPGLPLQYPGPPEGADFQEE